MSQIKQITVPDIGGAANVEVIEIAVKPGDQITKEATLITLESEKASIDIPSPMAGTVKEIKVKVGDKVSEGGVIVLLETEEANAAQPAQDVAKPATSETPAKNDTKKAEVSKTALVVPDIGTDSSVEVIELAVKSGDEIEKDATLITLESEKASLDIPSVYSGKLEQILVKVGDKVKKGDIIGYILTTSSAAPATTSPAAQQKTEKSEPVLETKHEIEEPTVMSMPNIDSSGDVHAGPAVRRLAYQLGVDLSKIAGTGRKERVLPEDLHAYVKKAMQGQGGTTTNGAGLNLLPWPNIDFGKFGEVDVQPLSRIKKISGANLHRNWVMIPHVTQFEEADITEMEEFRQNNKQQAEKEGAKLTPLVFIMKAVVAALKKYPKFNASLDASGENLVMKKYFHIGVAVDTPNGLVVPVIRDADQKTLIQLSKELAEVSKKARDGKLSPADMQGGCFSISSLGGIGGTAFTPIVNAPEVAILGVSRSEIKPKFMQDEFKARLMLPLSLSYDHRVIDGADAARFAAYLAECLADIRRLLL